MIIGCRTTKSTRFDLLVFPCIIKKQTPRNAWAYGKAGIRNSEPEPEPEPEPELKLRPG